MAGYKAQNINLGETDTTVPTKPQGNNFETFAQLAEYLGIDPNNPTPENQKKVADWMKANPDYVPGSVTNKYMEGYEEPPAAEEPQPTQTVGSAPTTDAMTGDPRYKGKLFDAPQQTPEVPDVSNVKFNPVGLDAWNPLSVEENQRHLNNINAGTQAYENKLADRKAKVHNVMQGLSNAGTEAGSVLSGALSAWTPLAASAFGGVDPSGFSAAQRAQAAQYDKNAAENQKIMQWNKQRATDNTLADKIAAAEAAGAWKQNANARGAEGGASVVAATNETVTPDIMAQKNYQSQQMNTATQNLAEVNRNKLEANAARGDANQADYQDRYMNSKDAYTQNLATAKGANTASKDTKEPESEENKPAETKPVATKPAETKTETGETPEANENGSVAPTNKESDAVEEATEQAAQDQTEQADMLNILNGVGDYDWTHDYYRRLEEEKNKSAISGK